MDAKKPRQDGDNTFSRKLGAKQYELTDHLGNVVATISDKKIHPQELVTAGSQNVDTTLGFQADVTGRYDYYPFDMEIQSRSGDYTNIDYTTDINKLLYSGLLKDCDAYILRTSGNISKYCNTAKNLYGQDYIDTIRIDRPIPTYFGFAIDLPLDEVIGEIDPEGNYSIQFTFTSEGRWVYDWPNIRGIESIDGNPDATLNEIREAEVKYLTFHYTGAELNSLATNHILQLKLQDSPGQSGNWDSFVKINKIKVTQTFKNTTVPLARRDEAAYTYGFNGMERDDEVKGSGNSYDFGARMLDPRLGRWFAVDPLAVRYPSHSPYNFVANSPILFVDPDGKKIVVHYSDADGKKQKIKLKKPTDVSLLKNVDNGFVKNMYETLTYLQEGGVDEVNQAISSKKKVHVKQGIGASSLEFIPKERVDEDLNPNGVHTIIYDPLMTTELLEDDGTPTGKHQSAALDFLHEIGHFLNRIKNGAKKHRENSEIK